MITLIDCAGVFDGIAVPVKNCIRVRGYVLSSGSKAFLETRAASAEDSPGVARLRAAGV